MSPWPSCMHLLISASRNRGETILQLDSHSRTFLSASYRNSDACRASCRNTVSLNVNVQIDISPPVRLVAHRAAATSKRHGLDRRVAIVDSVDEGNCSENSCSQDCNTSSHLHHTVAARGLPAFSPDACHE
jgi:hypothetical protein